MSILYAFTIGISRIVVKVSLGAKDPWRWFEIRFGIKEGSIYFRKHSSRIVIPSLNFSIQMFILCIFIQNQYDINFVSQTCLNLFRFNMVWIVKIYVILKQVTYLFRFKMTWIELLPLKQWENFATLLLSAFERWHLGFKSKNYTSIQFYMFRITSYPRVCTMKMGEKLIGWSQKLHSLPTQVKL